MEPQDDLFKTLDRMRGQQTRPPCMDDLLRHSNRNAVVRACLQYWQRGDISLEQSLVMMACHLAHANERLTENAVVAFAKGTPVAAPPAAASPPPAWTRVPPAVAGWYWLRRPDDDGELEVNEVSYDNRSGEWIFHGEGGWFPVSGGVSMGYEWCGPLEVPK